MDMNKLQPKALAAAMKGGTDGWGQVASAAEHVRYAEPVRPTSRRRCACGCKGRATLMGMANGMALATGCELAIARWVKTGRTRAAASFCARRATHAGQAPRACRVTNDGAP